METPSSTTRRVTRSQTIASANTNLPISRKIEESEMGVSKSRKRSVKQQDRSALIDITNDSPIVGLAMGSLKTPSPTITNDSPIVGLAMGSLKTPSSTMSKKRNNSLAKHGTPGSGEALLRGQVKTLLQKVEEEAELSKLSLEHNRPFLLQLQGLVDSPMGLLAPTPANTPHVLNLSAADEESFKNSCLASVTPFSVQEQFDISQMVADIFGGKMQEGLESENSLITRSLLMDFSEKSESPDSSSDCSSVLTYKGGESDTKEKSITDDDDDVSDWSIQVNTSTREDEEEEEEEEEEEDNEDDCENYYDEVEREGEEDHGDGGLVDELCKGLSKISVNGGEKKVGKFAGKHTKFVYNSDGELEGEEECDGESQVSSADSLLRLKGLPTPKGKHLRFPQELEEEDH